MGILAPQGQSRIRALMPMATSPESPARSSSNATCLDSGDRAKNFDASRRVRPSEIPPWSITSDRLLWPPSQCQPSVSLALHMSTLSSSYSVATPPRFASQQSTVP
eukprot:scaffold952_cov249-Pinguiococcus_pyrenoidosus.AAC.31